MKAPRRITATADAFASVELDLDHIDRAIARSAARAALIHRVEARRLRRTHAARGSDALPVAYTYRGGLLHRRAGSLPFRRPRADVAGETAQGMPEFCGWSVNVRCLERRSGQRSISARPWRQACVGYERGGTMPSIQTISPAVVRRAGSGDVLLHLPEDRGIGGSRDTEAGREVTGDQEA